MAGDALWPYVSVCLEFTGTNGGVIFSDLSRAHTFSNMVGSPTTSTTVSVTSPSSLYVPNLALGVNLTDQSLLNFGSGDFEIECWVWQVSRSGVNPASIFNFQSDSPSAGWRVYINTTGTVSFFASGIGIATTGGTVPLNQWVHICVIRISGILTIFINGVISQNGNFAGTITNYPVGPLQISGALVSYWLLDGYMDRIQILKGTTRHTATPFTPGTSAFVLFYGQIAGVVRDDTNALCQRTIRSYSRNTGALIASTTSSAVTGAYSMDFSSSDEQTVVFLDDDPGTVHNSIVVDKVVPAP